MKTPTREKLRMALYDIEDLPGVLFPRTYLKRLGKKVYNYHNLGSGVFPEGEEKTPFGDGERYNYDRMYMMVSNFAFQGKNVLDLGCNSGWFCVQSKLLGAANVVGIDYKVKGMMGQALRYAIQYERAHRLGIKYHNSRLEAVDFPALARRYNVPAFDAVLMLSVFHHVWEEDLQRRKEFFANLRSVVRNVIFYEDHEFWNEMYDANNNKLTLKGEGYRFGWNEDLSWQRKISAIENYEKMILDYYKTTWRNDVFQFDSFRQVSFLGFSEKRRPMLALYV